MNTYFCAGLLRQVEKGGICRRAVARFEEHYEELGMTYSEETRGDGVEQRYGGIQQVVAVFCFLEGSLLRSRS